MRYDKIVTLVLLAVLILSGMSVLAQSADGKSQNDTTAQHKEFLDHDMVERRDISMITINEYYYNYSMGYDLPPEGLNLYIEGTMDPVEDYSPGCECSLIRPDGEEIQLLDMHKFEKTSESFSTSFYPARNTEVRSEIYNWAKQYADPVQKTPQEIDPIKVIFSKANENILSDPETLKGDYQIKVTIMGDNVELDYGKKKTWIVLNGQPPSSVRNLEGTYDGGNVELDWDKPDSTGGSDIIQYNIYRATTSYYYEYIGNVSAGKTEFVDEIDYEEIRFKEYSEYMNDGCEGSVLFYKILAVNKDIDHYSFMVRNSYNLSEIQPEEYPKPYSSVEEIVHIPIGDTEKSKDMSYKWVMDYSSFKESYIKERLKERYVHDKIDSVTINEIKGGDFFMYDIDKVSGGEERKYEYEGAFYSDGRVDIEIDSEEITTSFIINVTESWCKFSGNIWAEEYSDEGIEGLSITKQTIKSEGKVDASLESTYDFNNGVEDVHWETSKDIDTEWDIDLELDYQGNNSWVMDKKKGGVIPPLAFKFNYSGSVSGDVDVELSDNKNYNDKDIDESVDQEVSGSATGLRSGLYSVYHGRTFSPVVGASRIGFLSVMDQAFGGLEYSFYDQNHYSSDTLNETIKVYRRAFETNSQTYDYSMDKLYKHQVLDPMDLPGIGSFMGCELKKAQALNNDNMAEAKIKGKVRELLQSGEGDPSERDKLEEECRRKLWGDVVTKDSWKLDQERGLLGQTMDGTGLSFIEPVGYYGSQPIDDGDMKSFEEDKQQFVEDQLEGAGSEDDDGGSTPGFTVTFLLVGILISLIAVYRRK